MTFFAFFDDIILCKMTKNVLPYEHEQKIQTSQIQ